MIERYSLPEMASLFTDNAKLSRWLDVEVLATKAWSRLGVVPSEAASAVAARAPRVDDDFVKAVAAREAVTDHDVAAFVDVVQAAVGMPEGAWVHYGLTSSDVVDTALGCTLAASADLLVEASTALVNVLVRRARELAEVPMVGRTHGMFAEPITFGSKLALWALQADRDRRRLLAARRSVAVGKLSGAVGTYSNVDPAVESYVCEALHLLPVPATQVVARDRHAEYLWACASAGTGVETFATEVRLLARSEVGEVQEPFGRGQKGSSAMPHKRNPVLSERLCGLARLLRGYLSAGLEDVALWHERDISHSSVERVALADASCLTHYMLRRMATLVEGLVVSPERMAANLDASCGLVFSQPVLLALVAAGMDRDVAYRIVQRDSAAASEKGISLRSVLESDPEARLSEAEMDVAFDLEHALRNTKRTIDALDELEVSQE